MLEWVAVGSAVVTGLLYAREKYAGCSGGHIWGEWQYTERLRTDKGIRKMKLYQEKLRRCKRDGCRAVNTEEIKVCDVYEGEELQVTYNGSNDVGVFVDD